MRYLPFCVIGVLIVLQISCKGPVGPAGPDFASLTDPSVQPAIISTYPPADSRGPYVDYNNKVVIRFNKIMDRTSIQRSVAISSVLGDVRVDTTSIASQNTDGFTFTPLDIRGSSYKFLWKIGQSYTISIDPSAFDVNGNHLRAKWSASFTPEPVFRIVGITPVNATTDVATSSNITLTFNSPVDSSIIPLIHVTPALTGQWRYIAAFPAPDSSILRLTYQGGKPDSTYTVSIDPSAHDEYGNLIQGAYASSFTMMSFRPSATIPSDGAATVAISNAVVVTFPAALDTSTVRGAFSIQPPISGTFLFTASGTQFRFNPVPRFLTSTKYSITISTAIASKAGEHPSVPYVFSFTTIPFQVSSTTPPDGGINVSPTTGIIVRFSDLIDTGSIRAAFSIDPPGAGTFTLRDSTSLFTFTPAGSLAPATVYTCTLAGSLRSSRGDSLGIPESFMFSTLPFAVSATNPSGGATGVSPVAGISITFTLPLDTTGLGSALTITPELPGYASSAQGSTVLQYIPTSQLLTDTMYTVTVSPTVRSESGAVLGQPFEFSFSTATFGVSTTTPVDGSIGVSPSASLIFSFNAPVDTGTIRSAFSISGNPPGRLTMNASNFWFTPSPALTAGTWYTATVGAGVRSKGGSVMVFPVTVTFQTSP